MKVAVKFLVPISFLVCILIASIYVVLSRETVSVSPSEAASPSALKPLTVSVSPSEAASPSALKPLTVSVSPSEAERPSTLRPLMTFVFDDPAVLELWHEKSYKGKTLYEVQDNGSGEKALRGFSEASASGLFMDVEVHAAQMPFLTWTWRVAQFPSNKINEALNSKKENDFGARVYAIFKGKLPFSYEVIQYIWDNHFPEGTYANNPTFSNVKYFVVENSPPKPQGSWVSEVRNLTEDYEMLFGKPLEKNLIVIGLMSDSDNTGTVSEAYFGKIAIEQLRVS